MDISLVNEAIQDFEESELTAETAYKLASLYIIRDNLSASSHDMPHEELSDIFPYYSKYRDAKRRYQLNLTTEGEVISGIKSVCKELQEFVETLYSNTDMNKERLCIKAMLKDLYTKYNK